MIDNRTQGAHSRTSSKGADSSNEDAVEMSTVASGTASGTASGAVSETEPETESERIQADLAASAAVAAEIAENTPKSPGSRIFGNVVKVGLASGLIFWMIKTGKLNLSDFAKLATPGLISFCIVCIFFQIFINNYRWMLLLRGQGIATSIKESLPLSFIGMFFNFVMPGGVGGDVIKGYYLLQDRPSQKFACAISIFMDRMVGFFVMVATAFLAVFFNWSSVAHSPELQSVAIAVALLFFGFVFFFILALSRRLGKRVFSTWIGHLLFVTMPGAKKIKRVYDVVHTYRNVPRKFFAAFALSLFNQLLFVGFVYGVAIAMNVSDLPLMAFFFLVPVGAVVMALPISPAGIGVGQTAFYFLFSYYLGRPSQLGPTAVTFMQVTNLIWGLFGAYFYLQRKKPVLTAETSSVKSAKI